MFSIIKQSVLYVHDKMWILALDRLRELNLSWIKPDESSTAFMVPTDGMAINSKEDMSFGLKIYL
jgi:hypothetical protein